MIRTVIAGMVLAVGLVVPLGCTDSDETAEPTTVADSAVPNELCVRFPLRDAGALFQVPDDPALAGDPAVADQLLDMAAAGLAESAPETIRPAVDVYAAALREHVAGTDPMADGSTRSAVEQINGWLRSNCPPPPATTP
jgi:hypothetical protein